MTESRRVELQVEPAEQRERLDLFLARRVRSLPRTLLQRLIRDGHVLLDDRPASRPAQRVGFIRRVRITVPAVEPDEPPLHLPPARVLLNDGWLLAIDKPAGYPVVGKLARAGEDCVRAARRLLGSSGSDAFVGPCHRLDRDTSGVLLLALRPDAAAALGRAFVQGEVRKTYAALCESAPDPARGAIDLPIHAPGDDFPRIDHERGRPARTLYRTVATTPSGGALLLLRPRTGRTHQLRLHLAALDRPIRGDRMHGGAPAERLHLHAWSLTFPHPATGRLIRLRAPLPTEFETCPRGGCEGARPSPD